MLGSLGASQDKSFSVELWITPFRFDGVFGAAKYARFSFYYLARELTRLSFPQIGKIIHRDHSTVFHGVESASRSPEIMEAVNQIKAGLVRIGL